MPPVMIELPDAALAPNYRSFLANDAEFDLHDVDGNWVLIEPCEGSGTVREYFRATKLCDANTTISEETWEPLRGCPPWEDRDLARRHRLIQEAERLAALGRPEATMRALEAGILGANVETPELLEQQMPAIFAEFPNASLCSSASMRSFCAG